MKLMNKLAGYGTLELEDHLAQNELDFSKPSFSPRKWTNKGSLIITTLAVVLSIFMISTLSSKEYERGILSSKEESEISGDGNELPTTKKYNILDAWETEGHYMKTTMALDKSTPHSVVFAIKQRNLDQLEKTLYEVSDPASPYYGQHRTAEEVAELTSNPDGAKIVADFLTKNNVEIQNTTPHGEYITAVTSIESWENILQTDFHTYQHKQDNSKIVHRAVSMTLHPDIEYHIQAVFRITDFPMIFSMKEGHVSDALASPCTGIVTPSLINTKYNINSNEGNNYGSIGLYISMNQYYSSTDLAMFQSKFNIPNHPVDFDPYNRDDPTCTKGPCDEGNLDLEYLTAVARNVPVTVIYDNQWGDMTDWLTYVSTQAHPPLVQSISYSGPENIYGSFVTTFNIQAQKLGVMGVTIVASSGDEGAMGNIGYGCGYLPQFPASSPYVTAVGATMGIEKGGPEVAMDSSLGGVKTSGGGFSSTSTAPDYQKSAIASYFSNVSPKPVSGYNAAGRGIPDVSMPGTCLSTVIKGSGNKINFGTSASTPVFAGMVALVNAARLKAGKSAVGWINPTLYASGGSFANDIIAGNNKCFGAFPASNAQCCSQGFYATKGWDPVTGFGSVDFSKFYSLFMSGSVAPVTNTNKPTAKPTSKAPTKKPTTKPTPKTTALPSKRPSIKPTIKTTALPSKRPSTKPTIKTTALPSRRPSTKPTIKTTALPSKRPSIKPTI